MQSLDLRLFSKYIQNSILWSWTSEITVNNLLSRFLKVEHKCQFQKWTILHFWKINICYSKWTLFYRFFIHYLLPLEVRYRLDPTHPTAPNSASDFRYLLVEGTRNCCKIQYCVVVKSDLLASNSVFSVYNSLAQIILCPSLNLTFFVHAGWLF